MEIKLSQNEVNNLSEEVYNLIKEIPIFYLNEIVENAVLERKKEGEIENIDYITSSEEEEEEEENSTDEDSSDESESD